MSKTKNIETINDFVKLPITIESDSDYKDVLKVNLDNYLKWVGIFINDSNYYISRLDSGDKNNVLKTIKNDCVALKRSVKDYNAGKVDLASRRILGLLKRIRDDDENKFVVSDIDSSYSTRLGSCIPGISNEKYSYHYERIKKEELTFYRARTEYFDNPKEMYHIPLSKRDLVGTQRFSIPGVPCLYLGTSVYDVWLEMGRPAYSDFNVSAVKLRDEGKKLMVLNLAYNPYVLLGIAEVVTDESGLDITRVIEITISMLRLYPVIIATSVQNKKSSEKFRSEYIVSHLLMMNLQAIGCDGIAYLSKRIEGHEEYALPQIVNVAFPAYEASKVDRDYGTICEKIEITRPRNYEEFMSLELDASDNIVKNSYYAKAFGSEMNDSQNSTTYVVSCGRYIDYKKTTFYRFENNLCGQKFYNIDEVKNYN